MRLVTLLVLALVVTALLLILQICRSLAMLRDKKVELPWKKHGNLPL